MKYAFYILVTGKMLTRKTDRSKAKRIMQDAQHRLEVLMAENAGDSKELRSHTYQYIYPGIAMYQAMVKEEFTKEEAAGYLRECGQKFGHLIAPVLRTIMKIPTMVERVPGVMVSMAVRQYSEASGFEYEWPELPDGTVGWNMIRCPYFDTFTRYGCAELTTAYCDMDDAAYGNMHPCLIWGRTSTLGYGAPCCDFRLTYTQKQTEK